MKVIKGFDPESNQLVVKVTSNLVKEYYQDFSKIIDLDFKGRAEVSLDDSETASVIGLKMEDFDRFEDSLNKFTNNSLGHKMKITEFIPLSGYPIEKLQEEIVDAVKEKRNLCIIKDYQEYLRSNTDKRFVYTQKDLFYGTLEYSKAVILIWRGDLEKLVKRYKSSLIVKDWC